MVYDEPVACWTPLTNSIAWCIFFLEKSSMCSEHVPYFYGIRRPFTSFKKKKKRFHFILSQLNSLLAAVYFTKTYFNVTRPSLCPCGFPWGFLPVVCFRIYVTLRNPGGRAQTSPGAQPAPLTMDTVAWGWPITSLHYRSGALPLRPLNYSNFTL